VHDGLRILDADAHVVEPGDLFSAWTPPGRPVLDLPATTPIELCGDSSRLADLLEHGFDAASYLRAMDAQRIDAAVLFPSMGLFVRSCPSWIRGRRPARAARTTNGSPGTAPPPPTD